MMSDSVLAIVGEWECGDLGRWRFRVCPAQMARFVAISEATSYEALVSNVAQAFDVDETQNKTCLSFLYETETTAFTQWKMPPVSISCNVGLGQFKKARNGKTDLAILVTFKSSVCEGNMAIDGVKVSEIIVNRRVEENSISDEALVAHMEKVEADLLSKRVVDIDKDRVGGKRTSGMMVDKSRVGDEVSVSGGSVEEDYDSDEWTELINKDYPPDWDPFEEAEAQRLKRKKISVEKVIVPLTSSTIYLAGESHVEVVGRQPSIDNGDAPVGDRRMELVVFSPRNDDVEEGIVRNLSPIGFSLGLGESPIIGSEMMNEGEEVACGQEVSDVENHCHGVDKNDQRQPLEMTNEINMGGQMRAFVDDDDVFVEDSFVYDDPPPVRDNMRGLPSDEANMDLRRRGDAIYVGKVYKDKNELRKALTIYAMKRKFHFKMGKSDTKRAIANCADPSCEWRVYATTHKNSHNVEIRTLCLKHTCSVATRAKYGNNASSKILADIMKAKFANGKRGPRACEIPELVLSECNVTISYMKAWHAKELAVASSRGTEEASYQFLSTYLHLLETSNPGTISNVHTTVDKDGATPFKYLFFALGGSIAGYKYLRKVIVIDGTQMKGKYKGCLVAASGQDGNAQIFPLGFGVIDGENEKGWEWFFRQLTAFVPDEEDLVFVSDRHAAIYSGLEKVYPLAHHGSCTVHLLRNVKHRYKSEGLAKIVNNAARAFTIGDFGYWFDEIKKRRPACAKYLTDIGFEHWSLAHFKGKRYNVMSSNISESLNNAMKKAVDYPIAVLVEFIRGMLMRWFCSRREVAGKAMSKCTPEVEDQLIEHLAASTDCGVISASSWIYQVNDGSGCVFNVDLEKRTCSCRVFDVLMIPCCHAVAAIGINGVDIHSLVGDCYSVKEWRNLYEHVILPVPKVNDIEVPSAILGNGVMPPKTRRASGRPKKKRIPSQGEQMGGKQFYKCSRCCGRGHNKATCKNPI